jgi:hypothetical protein
VKDLIESFQIFSKYCDEEYPTWCEHDALHVNVDESIVSEDDIKRLDELGFFVDEEGGFKSYRFGSS